MVVGGEGQWLANAGVSSNVGQGFYSLNHYGVNGADYVDFIFTFADANTWSSGYRQSGRCSASTECYSSGTYTKDIEIYTGDTNFGPWTKVATGSHSKWHNGATATFTDDGTTTEWTPTAPSKYLLVRTLTNHGDTYAGGRLSVRSLQLKFSRPLMMDWKWPGEHNVDCKDYHPRIGGGQEVVNGWGRGPHKLANACEPSNPHGYFLSYNYYGVGGGDYIDFIFTFEDANTWCSGYRQFGHSDWHSFGNSFTKYIEISTANANFGPWTKVATGSHSTWHNGAMPTFSNAGTTTEWTPTAPSKYLRVRTFTNHGSTYVGGQLSVRFLQLRFALTPT